MTALFALVLAALPASADATKTVPNLTGSGVRIHVVAAKADIEVTCKAITEAKGTLQSGSLTFEAKPADGGAKFSVAGTGGGKLILEIPADVKLRVSGLEKSVKVRGCKGNVLAEGPMASFDIDTPGADVVLKVDKGALSKQSIVAQAQNISMNIPDVIDTTITATSISMNIPDIAPANDKKMRTVKKVYGAGTTPVTLKAAQSITIAN